MRRVSSAPNLHHNTKSVHHSTSSDKLDKANSHSQKRMKVQSVSDLANLMANTLIENKMVQYSQLMSTSKGVASAVCFEAEASKAAPAIEEELASCLSSPLMEEGDPLLELDIVDANTNVVVPFKRPKRRVLTRWDVPSRIAKRV